MKTIDQLTNVEKAKIIFDLFRAEMPDFLEYVNAIAEKIADSEKEMIANWNNPILSYQQWLNLSYQVTGIIKRYAKGITKSANVFSEQLFGGYLAIFSNHCLEQYGLNKAKSLRFALAIKLFYLPVKEIEQQSYQYLVLEMHGGPEYAAICTDEDGITLVFDNREDAEKEAADCQDGLVVKI